MKRAVWALLVVSGCTERAEPSILAVHVESVADAAQETAPSVAPSASVAPPEPAPPTPSAPAPLLKQRLVIAEGTLDVYEVITDPEDHFSGVDSLLRLESSKGRSTLRFRNADDPSLRSVRFGDATQSSVVLTSRTGWVTGYAIVQRVVEVEDGKLLWRHARHVVTGKLEAIETSHEFSGASVDADQLRIENGVAELLNVRCGQADPSGSCTSHNRIFFVRDGHWLWDERDGSACRPKSNGWCAAKWPFPTRSEFP